MTNATINSNRKITDVRFYTDHDSFYADIIIGELLIVQAGSAGVYVPAADEIFVDKTFQRKAHDSFSANDVRQVLAANGVQDFDFDSLQALASQFN